MKYKRLFQINGKYLKKCARCSHAFFVTKKNKHYKKYCGDCKKHQVPPKRLVKRVYYFLTD